MHAKISCFTVTQHLTLWFSYKKNTWLTPNSPSPPATKPGILSLLPVDTCLYTPDIVWFTWLYLTWGGFYHYLQWTVIVYTCTYLCGVPEFCCSTCGGRFDKTVEAWICDHTCIPAYLYTCIPVHLYTCTPVHLWACDNYVVILFLRYFCHHPVISVPLYRCLLVSWWQVLIHVQWCTWQVLSSHHRFPYTRTNNLLCSWSSFINNHPSLGSELHY